MCSFDIGKEQTAVVLQGGNLSAKAVKAVKMFDFERKAVKAVKNFLFSTIWL